MVHVRGIDLCSRQLCRSLCLIMLEKYWTIRSKAQNGKIAAMDESVFHEFHQFVLFTEALCTYALRVQEVNEIKLKPTIHKFENSKRSCQCFLPFKQKRCPLKGTSFKFLIKLICIRRSLMCVHIYRLPEHTISVDKDNRGSSKKGLIQAAGCCVGSEKGWSCLSASSSNQKSLRVKFCFSKK